MADFQIDPINKTFTIVVAGFAKESVDFVKNLKEKVATIEPHNFTLILNGEEMKTFKPEVLVVLEQAYQLYMSFGFKYIVVLSPKRVTPRLQLKRIAKKCNFTGRFVKGKEEARQYLEQVS